MDLNEVLTHFDGVKKISTAKGCNETYAALCPSHSDKTASLHISESVDDKILINCKAGCSTEEILSNVGLTFSDLGAAKEEPLPSWKNKLEAEYRYFDEEGNYLYSKLRYEGKQIRYARTSGKKYISGKGDKPASLYNLPTLLKAINDGFPVYYVEGEKDVNTMKKYGLTATTAGGAGDWRQEYGKYFTGARVVILPDNDGPGQELAEMVRRNVRDYAHSVKVVTVSTEEHGDVTDYIQGGNSKEDLLDLISEVPLVLAPWVYLTNEGKPNQKQNINVGILAESIYKHQDLFIARKPGAESDLIYWYENGVYRLLSRTELIGKVKKYVPSSLVTPALLRNTADAIIYSCPTMTFSELNKSERYINVKNGLYDIETKTLISHTPEVIGTIQLNCKYPENYEPPSRWIQFLCDLCTDENKEIDTEMFNLIQEWLGLIFSNVYGYRSKRALTLYSAIGNTGKSVLISVCSKILGDGNVANVTFQDMDGSRWATGRLLGTRLVAVGDQGSGDLESSSIFKQLTGGDMVSAEFKGKQGFDFTFTGIILVACNILPVFTDDKGDHIFKRLEFANCRNVIPDALQDKTLGRKLAEEADQLFRWSLDGLHRFIDNNYSFTSCKSGQQLKETYREDIDPLYKFVKEHCDITENQEDRILRSEFHDEYLKFCDAYEITPMKPKNITKRARKLALGEVKNGKWYYTHVKWKDIRPAIGYYDVDF